MLFLRVSRHLYRLPINDTFQKLFVTQGLFRQPPRLLSHIAKDVQPPNEVNEDVVVYYGTLTPQIRAVKVFSLLTSFTGIAVQPALYTQLEALNSTPIFVVVYSFVGFFTFATPFLLHALTKKYITELVYKPDVDKYEATTINFFLRKRKVLFSIDEVSVPDVPGIFTTFVVNGKGLFVDSRMFKDHSHYGKIMGFDKPLDLKLGQTSLNESDAVKKV